MTHTQAADGFYYADGQRLCEDCWQPIPRYVDFPDGLVSPESDGDAGGNFAKFRPANIEGKDGREALRKAVCLPCYHAAFARVYPGAVCGELNPQVRTISTPYVQAPEPPMVYIPEPRA